jgi:hypothetical protein
MRPELNMKILTLTPSGLSGGVRGFEIDVWELPISPNFNGLLLGQLDLGRQNSSSAETSVLHHFTLH